MIGAILLALAPIALLIALGHAMRRLRFLPRGRGGGHACCTVGDGGHAAFLNPAL